VRLAPDAARKLAVGDRALVRVRHRGREAWGEVVRKLGRPEAAVLGMVERGGRGLVLRASDKRLREEFLLTKLGGAVPGDLVRARISSERRAGRPLAEVIERIGPADHPGAASAISIAEQGVPVEFPDDALAEAARVTPPSPAERTDLRHVPFVTIDGADARDFDDAVFAEQHGEGFTLMVAIADVGWYVRPGAPLDRAALERGNSVYFPDRVVPMLPERLSNDLCSLRPNEDKAAMVCTIVIDAHGRKQSHRFDRALIRSAARLTYDSAQAIKDRGRHESAPAAAVPLVQRLYDAWGALSRARRGRQPLDLDVPERQIVMGPDGSVRGVMPRARLDSHRLIEDFMIAANVAAAEQLSALSLPALNRVHDPPDPVKVAALATMLESLGHRLAKGQVLTPAHFNKVLGWAAETPWARMVNDAVLRSQSLAVYSPADRGHFGLSLRRYAHFTSPIRRYADLVVHRALIQGLKLGPGGLNEGGAVDLAQIADHISATERKAVAAERAAADRLMAAFLADRVGAEFAARVSGVAAFGCFVTLDETGADALVPMARLPPATWRHDPRRQALSGGRMTLRAGDAVLVRLDAADPLTGGLLCSLIGQAGIGQAGIEQAGEPSRPRPPARHEGAKRERPRPNRRQKGRRGR
jgi:ribonuclease R